MKNVYLLINKSMMLIGIFTSWKRLQMAMDVAKEVGKQRKIYWAKVETNGFDSLLPNFWIMHYEKLNEVNLVED